MGGINVMIRVNENVDLKYLKNYPVELINNILDVIN